MARVNRGRRGSVSVEMALLLPLVMLLTTGLVEYGWMFLKVQQINSAARNGARLASLPDAVNAVVLDAVAGELHRNGLGGSGYTVTLAPSDVSAPMSGEPVSVTVTVAYHNVALTGIRFLPTPSVLSATVTMSKEGP
jgi:Flp pilus assembly protein TadG